MTPRTCSSRFPFEQLPCLTGSRAAPGGRLTEERRREIVALVAPLFLEHGYEQVSIDDIVERTGLNSSDVLATLFDLEMKGFVRQSPGKQFSKILL